MGSSTRNSYKRSDRIINQEIEKGNINSEGAGIGELLAKIIFSKRGQTKAKAALNENLYSVECNNSIKNIIKVSKAVGSGNFSAIGLSGIGGLSGFEIKEKLCDFVGISDNELLKTSFKEALEKENLLDKSVSVIKFISQYVKNVISNIYKQFTYEDTLNLSENFNTEAYVTSVDNYMEEKVVPIIEFEFKEIDFNDDILTEEESYTSKIKNAFSNIIKKLRGDVENE